MSTALPADIHQNPQIAVAILFERLGHVIEKVDQLSAKLDQQDTKRTLALTELETRVEHIEKQVSSVRWFLAGIACAGGAVGGSFA
ncbi:MAG: hypothetical protein ACK5XN_28410, partial [Bacteroidota bacterium]